MRECSMAAHVPPGGGVVYGAPTVPKRMGSTGGGVFANCGILSCWVTGQLYLVTESVGDLMRLELPIKVNSRAQVLFLAGSAFVLVFILWQISAWTNILYPFRLFVTYVHEAGHGLTAVLTGGRWEYFRVFDNGAGVAYTAGG